MNAKQIAAAMAGLLFISGLASGCGTKPAASEAAMGETPVAQATVADNNAQDNIKIISESFYLVDNAKSIPSLLGSFDTVVVGTVTGAKDASESPGSSKSDGDDKLPPAGPKAQVPPQGYIKPDFPTNTEYTIQLLHVVKGDSIKTGDVILIDQPGGEKAGVSYQDESDPVLKVGATYLFFAQSEQPTWLDHKIYVSSPVGRFQLGVDGKLKPVAKEFANLQAVRDLAGLTPADAVAKVRALLTK